MRPGEASSAPVECIFPFASWFYIPVSSVEVAYSVEANWIILPQRSTKNYLKALIMSLTGQYVTSRNGFRKLKFKSPARNEPLFDMKYTHGNKSPLLPEQWASSFLPFMIALDRSCQYTVLCFSKRRFSAKGWTCVLSFQLYDKYHPQRSGPVDNLGATCAQN